MMTRKVVDGDNPDNAKGFEHPKNSPTLSGTTLRVYRFLYKEGKPLNIHDVQRGLNLSSASVSQYHLRKLLQAGLVKEQEEGFVVDRVVFENMIRIRRMVIPFQIAYVAFFATMLAVLILFLRNASHPFNVFLFAFAVTLAALILFSYEVLKSLRRRYI